MWRFVIFGGAENNNNSQAVILMGPAGCGKSTIGQALAEQTAWHFIEGDDYHPDQNVAMQAEGIPLSDKERAAWLDNLVKKINEPALPPTLIVACSALTPYVQNRLKTEIHRSVRFILLHVNADRLRARLTERQDHFMPASLLKNQLQALLPPVDAHWVEADRPIHDICTEIMQFLKN